MHVQIGMGGGMMVGINVWRALNTNNSLHPAWLHLASTPLTEQDLPRSIESPAAAQAVTAAAAGGGGVMSREDDKYGEAVAPQPTVQVKAFEPLAETDEELADRAH